MPRTVNPLTRVSSARRRWEAAEEEFLEAIVAARESGATLRAIAEAAGRSPGGVLKLLRR